MLVSKYIAQINTNGFYPRPREGRELSAPNEADGRGRTLVGKLRAAALGILQRYEINTTIHSELEN